MSEKKYVLIIEDNATDVSVLQGLLKREGVHYTVLFDSRDVPGMIQQLPVPDAVFLDLEMPGMSGYDVLAILQAEPSFKGVPVVAYTSHLSEMVACREAGFHSFLGKPVKGERFSEHLDKIFKGNSVWDGR
jgi:CheY-like chemotaxis protein